MEEDKIPKVEDNVTTDVEHQQLSVVESPTQQKTSPEQIQTYCSGAHNQNALLVKDAQDAGIIFSFAEDVNRDLKPKKVEELKEDVLKSGAFLLPIWVIPAEEYFKFYPDRKVKADGKEYDKSSPDIYRLLVCEDGYHRKAAEQALLNEHKDYKPTLKYMFLTLPEGLTPDQWMVKVNTKGSVWTSKDRTKHIVNITAEMGETNISVAKQLQEKHRMGERAAYAILNQSDCYVRSLQVNIMNNPNAEMDSVLKGTDEKRAIGKQLVEAFAIAFRTTPRMMKNMAAINLALAIFRESNFNTQIWDSIYLFFYTLNPAVAEKALKAHSVVEKTAVLRKEWCDFQDKIKDPQIKAGLEVEAKRAKSEWGAAEKAAATKKEQPKAKKATTKK